MTGLNWIKGLTAFLSTRPTGPVVDVEPEIFLGLHLSEVEQRATVDETIYPHKVGRVRFFSSVYPARCDQGVVIRPGEVVHVVGRRNITLLVEPITSVHSNVRRDQAMNCKPLLSGVS